MGASGGSDGRLRAYALVASGALGLAACVTVLFLGMRAIMATGTGFVASGGPYEIAHPAPDGVWLIPVSILSAVGFIALHWRGAGRLQGYNLLMPMWVVVFFSLGANFLEFGVRGLKSGGAAWLLCGVVFWAMAVMPAFAPIVPPMQTSWMGTPRAEDAFGGGSAVRYTLVNVAAALAGVVAGWAVFTLLW